MRRCMTHYLLFIFPAVFLVPTSYATVTILSQPTDQWAEAGSQTGFSVVADSTDTPSYQWRRDGEVIPGATNADYTVNGLNITDSGAQFDVVITDSTGSITSRAALLQVDPVGGAGSWWSNAHHYRLPLVAGAGQVQRINKPVEFIINFTQLLQQANTVQSVFDVNSLRVVEVDSLGRVIDAAVPFQFDPAPGFNPTSAASGTLILIMQDTTDAYKWRLFHVYFDTTGQGFTPAAVPPQVIVTDGVLDENEESLRIDTPSGSWFYHKQGGGFSSLVDADGNDWIGYHPTGGSAGSYRGIPNIVNPEGHLHPGATTAQTTLISSGPLRASFSSTTTDGLWSVLWYIYPNYASMTITAAGHPYWFLYEGTPGGMIDPTSDFMVRSDGTKTLLSDAWTGDLSGEEWVYFSDPVVDRSLFLVNHQNDNDTDAYFDMNDQMTVFGFGRDGLTSYLTGAPQRFTVGLIDGTDFPATAAVIRSAYHDVSATLGTVVTNIVNSTPVPTISAIQVSANTDLATVTWQTDEPTIGTVAYGLGTNYELGLVGSNSLMTSHSVTLHSLSPGTTYHYQIRSVDSAGNLATSADGVMMTTLESGTALTPTQTLDQTPAPTSGGGGGCTVARADTPFDPTLPLLTVLVLIGLAYRKATKYCEGSA